MLRGYFINRIILVMLLVLCATGCGPKSAQLQEFSGDSFIMDTLVHITVFCENEQQGKKALTEAFNAFERINDLTDRFNDIGETTTSLSDVNKVNKNAGVRPVTVNEDTLAILERSEYFSELTGGAFDVSIAPIMELWGFGGNNHVPERQQINNVLSFVNFRKVEINRQKSTVFLPNKGMGLDLGGVAKGYATDQAVLALKEMGVNHAIINAGGNVYTLGTKPDGSPWLVGVQDPRNNGVIAIISVQDAALVTSGDYQRYFIQEGVRYHHILDPATGKQARDVMQTTVVSDSAMDADILSTSLFVMGQERGLEFARRYGDFDVMFVNTENKIIYTDALNGCMELMEEGNYRISSETGHNN